MFPNQDIFEPTTVDHAQWRDYAFSRMIREMKTEMEPIVKGVVVIANAPTVLMTRQMEEYEP